MLVQKKVACRSATEMREGVTKGENNALRRARALVELFVVRRIQNRHGKFTDESPVV